ncbi:MAG: aspartyl protease family protein [Deltaproteobacteria bacterium]|nr:aspartyl protease family protein [Deltaproteobacteria bacterium]
MGMTFLKLKVGNPARPRKTETMEFLIDTGALYSVVPASSLRRLGIRPDRVEEFTLAGGSHTKRCAGGAVFEIDGRRGPSPVIFGERDDATLVGAVTLEALGLMVDPLKRQLRPLPMLLV